MDEYINLFKAFILIGFILMMTSKIMQNDKASLCFKMISSFSILCISLLYAYFNQSNKFSYLVPIGMFFGLIGDYLLGLKVQNDISNKAKGFLLIGGFGSFFIGHIFYFLMIYKSLCLRFNDLILPLLLSTIIVVFILFFKKLKIMNYGKFLLPCIIYGYFLCFVFLTSFVCAIKISNADIWTVFIGFLLFLISDLILMVLYFSPKKLSKENDIILTFFNLATYFLAQYLLNTMNNLKTFSSFIR